MKLFNILLWIKKTSWQDLVQTTGCISKCFIRKYEFEFMSSENVKWSNDWISSFYLSAETTNHEVAIESYSYDVQVELREKNISHLELNILPGSDRGHWRLPRSVSRLELFLHHHHPACLDSLWIQITEGTLQLNPPVSLEIFFYRVSVSVAK